MSDDTADRLGGLPAEIRDADFALVARTTVAGVAQAIMASDGTVDRGYVSVSLPGGATVGTAVVMADILAAPPAALYDTLGTLPAVSAYLDADGAGARLAQASVSPLSADCAARTNAAAAQDRFPPRTRIRLCPGSGARLDLAREEALDATPPVRIVRAADDPVATVSLWLGDPTPLSMVLAPGTIIELSPAPDTVGAALSTGVAIVDDMMRMRAAGRITEVATILGGMTTHDMLGHLGTHPAASVLIGYGLLRTEEPEVMLAPLAEIAARRPAFADAAVLAGEAAARMGRHEEALGRFLAAADAGLPAFSFGVNYLIDRLRAYAPHTQGPVTDQALNDRAAAALAAIEMYAPAMMHNAVSTTYRLCEGSSGLR